MEDENIEQEIFNTRKRVFSRKFKIKNDSKIIIKKYIFHKHLIIRYVT